MTERIRKRGRRIAAIRARRGNQDNGDVFETVRLALSAGNGCRMDAYLDHRHLYEGVGGAFLMDTQQWLGVKYGHGGPLFPCQLTHGDVVSATMCRVATGREHFFSQGFHIFPTGTQFSTPLKPFVDNLTEGKAKRLSGNGWCLPAVAAWIICVWSNCMKKPEAQPSYSLTPQGNGNSGLGSDLSADSSSLEGQEPDTD